MTNLLPGFHTTGKPYIEFWQAKRVSNPQPSVLETDTLPIELLACRLQLKKLRWVVSVASRLQLNIIQ